MTVASPDSATFHDLKNYLEPLVRDASEAFYKNKSNMVYCYGRL